MIPTLIIRADATVEIGTGHVMRCLALAQGWNDRGGEALFISHCESDALRDRIYKEGFRFTFLDRTCPDASDLENTLDIIGSEKTGSVKWVVLDGYHFTSEYQQAIRDGGHRLVVMDDMNHLPVYHADILLNQNLHALNLKYRCDSETIMLLGSRYVLLRREFLEYGNFRRHIPDKAQKILVTLGGSDPENVTLRIIDALKTLDDSEIDVKVVVGPANPHKEMLSNALKAARFPNELLINPYNIPKLMAWADMAISAGGTTCWESMFMGLPSLVVILAVNQFGVVEHLMEGDLIINLGHFHELTLGRASSVIEETINGYETRSRLSKNSTSLVDGLGLNRVLNIISPTEIFLRPVKLEDCRRVWRWANDPSVRSISFSKAFIPWNEHLRWFMKRKKLPFFYIGQNSEGMPLGQARIDQKNDELVISVMIDEAYRKQGYGAKLIKSACDEVFKSLGSQEIHAYIESGNDNSCKAFIIAGFHEAPFQRNNSNGIRHLILTRSATDT